MSAFGGKADIDVKDSYFRLLPKTEMASAVQYAALEPAVKRYSASLP